MDDYSQDKTGVYNDRSVALKADRAPGPMQEALMTQGDAVSQLVRVIEQLEEYLAPITVSHPDPGTKPLNDSDMKRAGSGVTLTLERNNMTIFQTVDRIRRLMDALDV